ncbi:SMI1/KNR4 family protein [Mannheimia varigena]|uniref:SMI1/KNR4 family protein n=1 Tax=Mannheimia varigena TaxID=85404 RepID=UPI0003E37122|nr:SMI1/KNR4 family protein [Mannheimia varigena]AHG76691.1 Protein involved in beta-1 3-glucan synthesis-like protein [Mannheimia varigena USDA-ARS-USMARC-1312]
MQNHLQNIEQWLKNNAHKIYQESLNQPANLEKLDELEKLVGETLPNDFKILYQWHNGLNDDKNLGSLFYGYDFWNLDKVTQSYRNILEDKSYRETISSYLEQVDDEINLQGFVNQPKWIQFAHDGSRTGFYLDLNPGEKGTHGQVIFIDFDFNAIFVVARSIADFIQQVDQDMQEGRYHLSEEALEDGNHWLDVDSEIDILNWHKSVRWKK